MQLFSRPVRAQLGSETAFEAAWESVLRRTGLVLAVIAALGTASQATAQRADAAIDHPLKRSLNWFSYVAADDIREQCASGGRNRLRLIYNALWDEQVRFYDIFLQPDGTAGLNIGVIANQGSGGDVANLLVGSERDLSAPWRPKRGQRLLSPQETSELMGLLQASAAFGPPPDGLRLPDNDFWWTAASCRNGQWGFQAYHYPTDGFANVRFAEKLFSLDNVPIAVNRPRKLEPADLRRDLGAASTRRAAARSEHWMLVVGKDGLRPR